MYLHRISTNLCVSPIPSLYQLYKLNEPHERNELFPQPLVTHRA
jgi:hypothetical protein